ncbi:HAD-like domain-containing protein [Hypoxylon sp. FL1284]|nr:HAD-like domain-containing protein [Hypoxylon sp. FL1284]
MPLSSGIASHNAAKVSIQRFLVPRHLFAATRPFSASTARWTNLNRLPGLARSPKGRKTQNQNQTQQEHGPDTPSTMDARNNTPFTTVPLFLPSADNPDQHSYQPLQDNSQRNPYPTQLPEQPNGNERSMTSQNKQRKKANGARDVKVQPSAASGGVPDPSPEYLRAASVPTFLLPYARKILVVLDLNGTVLFRPDRRRSPTEFVERAGARAFIGYCVETFLVAVWSSATPRNVDRMCAQLLTPDQRRRVVAVWGRDRFGLTPDDAARRVVCYKRLSSLWADPQVRASHPDHAASGAVWDQSNTVLVDDTVEKARAEPFNLIQVPEFAVEPGDPPEPGHVLAQVHDYLNACAHQTDVSSYIRTHPFRADPNFVIRPHAPDPDRDPGWDAV